MSNYEMQGGFLKVGKGNAKKLIKALAGSNDAVQMEIFKKWSHWLQSNYVAAGETAGQRSQWLDKIARGQFPNNLSWNDTDELMDTFRWLQKNNIIRVKESPLRGKKVWRMVNLPARIFKLPKPNTSFDSYGSWRTNLDDLTIEITDKGVVRYFIHEGNHSVDRINQNPLWKKFMSAVKALVPGKRFQTGYWSEYNGEYMDEDEYEWKKDEFYNDWAL